MPLRLLVVEGNTRESRENYRKSYGKTPSEAYAAELQAVASDATCDIAFPADEGFNLPDGMELSGYDGVALTGSSLHLWKREPAVDRQVELARAVYKSQTAFFGSCWGIQIASVAAGGEVGKNARGRELSIARNIAPTEIGRGHPLLAGRPLAYDAPCVHLDIVETLPPDSTLLASNGMARVQAAEIRHEGGTFWGVQYHPEFGLRQLAIIMQGRLDMLVEEGFFADRAMGAETVEDWIMLEDDPKRSDIAWRYGLGEDITNPAVRRIELSNWIASQVRPQKSARGRA